MDNTTGDAQNTSIEGLVNSIIQPEQVVEEKQIDNSNDSEENTKETKEVETESDSDDVTDDYEASDDSEDESSEDSQDTEEVETPEEPVYTVKIDGTEKQVTLSELKRGYSGQEYVQKGMQEAAERRKQAEEVYSALLNERQQIANLYQQIQSGQFATPPKPPSREMFEADPIGYMEAKLDYDDKLAQFQQQNVEVQKLMAQQSRAQQAARHAYLQQELQSLKNVIPELANPESATKVRDKLLDAGRAYGYTPEEIGEAIDHRALHVLRDAMKYRELMQSKQAVEKKAVKNRQAPVKSGAKRIDNKSKTVDAQKTKLKQSGRIDDAIALMFR